jgi:hypothetical protein
MNRKVGLVASDIEKPGIYGHQQTCADDQDRRYIQCGDEADEARKEAWQDEY